MDREDRWPGPVRAGSTAKELSGRRRPPRTRWPATRAPPPAARRAVSCGRAYSANGLAYDGRSNIRVLRMNVVPAKVGISPCQTEHNFTIKQIVAHVPIQSHLQPFAVDQP